MAKEIERKFLVTGSGWRAGATTGRRLCQFYLSRDGRSSVRVRIVDDNEAFLTIKSASPGTTRDEFEYPIPVADARAMLRLAEGAVIDKIRHIVPFAGRDWEVDEFAGDNAGLLVAEIELDDPEARIVLPEWLGPEVTDDRRYYNASLAANPFRAWRNDTAGTTAPGTVTLRNATIADIPLLEAWDRNEHVIDSGGQNDGGWDWPSELQEPQPDWRQMLLAEVDGRPLGFIQIIDPEREETHYWGDCEPGLRAIDIWIGEAKDLGLGLGTVMMQLALERCFSGPEVAAVLIDPLLRNIRAQRFYARHGFQPVGERWFGADHCLVMRLDRATWESHRTAGGL